MVGSPLAAPLFRASEASLSEVNPSLAVEGAGEERVPAFLHEEDLRGALIMRILILMVSENDNNNNTTTNNNDNSDSSSMRNMIISTSDNNTLA